MARTRSLWKTGPAILALAMLASLAIACGQESSGSGSPPSPSLILSDPQVLEGAACGVDQPACPDSEICVVFQGIEHSPVCVADPCGAVECRSGRCAILESFPAQVTCRSS